MENRNGTWTMLAHCVQQNYIKFRRSAPANFARSWMQRWRRKSGYEGRFLSLVFRAVYVTRQNRGGGGETSPFWREIVLHCHGSLACRSAWRSHDFRVSSLAQHKRRWRENFKNRQSLTRAIVYLAINNTKCSSLFEFLRNRRIQVRVVWVPL